MRNIIAYVNPDFSRKTNSESRKFWLVVSVICKSVQIFVKIPHVAFFKYTIEAMRAFPAETCVRVQGFEAHRRVCSIMVQIGKICLLSLRKVRLIEYSEIPSGRELY